MRGYAPCSKILDNTANSVGPDVHKLYQGIPYSQNVMVLWYKCKCDFIHTHKKKYGLSFLSFHKTCNPSCTDFFPDCKKHVEYKAKFHLHFKVKHGFHCCDFHDTWNRQVSLCRDTEFDPHWSRNMESNTS
jgi:hypothetical protein